MIIYFSHLFMPDLLSTPSISSCLHLSSTFMTSLLQLLPNSFQFTLQQLLGPHTPFLNKFYLSFKDFFSLLFYILFIPLFPLVLILYSFSRFSLFTFFCLLTSAPDAFYRKCCSFFLCFIFFSFRICIYV